MTSVREEIDRLRGEFNRLRAEGNVPPEIDMLVNSLLVLFTLVLSIFMEKTTKKNSRNSSKPSSQTDKDDSSKAAPGSKSRGKKQGDDRFSNSRAIENVSIAPVNVCNVCGQDLSKTKCCGTERRTRIDIVFEKVVEHVDAEIKRCASCDSEVKGEFPNYMSGPLQYGNGLKAYLISLVVSQMVALNRIQKMVVTLIGVTISENTIIKYVLQLSDSLIAWENSAKEAILKQPTMHCDETSLRVNKKNYWAHVYSSGELTLKFLHPKRGMEAVTDIDIIPRYGGVVIHDCWASYFAFKNCAHALCGSHLLRELVFVIDSNGYRWAKCMKKLLQETCKKVSKRESKKLSSVEYANLRKRYRNIITRGENELPPLQEKKSGKRGKMAKSDAHNLLERMKLHEEGVLMFALNPHVSFTNNRAERDLRMGKVKQKVSGCFRSESLAEAYCRISSYLTTMANRGYNPLIAIQMALTGQVLLESME